MFILEADCIIKAIGKEVQIGSSIETDYNNYDETREERLKEYLKRTLGYDPDEEQIDLVLEALKGIGISVYSEYSGVMLYFEGGKIFAF